MIEGPQEPLKPTPLRERIRSLDLLRGFALLGILIMNIQSFSMVGAAYFNPMAFGDLSGSNGWAYILSHVICRAEVHDVVHDSLWRRHRADDLTCGIPWGEHRGCSLSEDVHSVGVRAPARLSAVGWRRAGLLCTLRVGGLPISQIVSQDAVEIGPGECADRIHHFSVHRFVVGVYPARRHSRDDEQLEAVRGTGARGSDGLPVGVVETDGETSRHGTRNPYQSVSDVGTLANRGTDAGRDGTFQMGCPDGCPIESFLLRSGRRGSDPGVDPGELRPGSQFCQELVAGLPIHRQSVQLLGKHSGEFGATSAW